MKHFALMALLSALPLHASAAVPSIHVGAMYEYAAPGRSALLKRIRNSGDATAFVRVHITEVRYDNDGKPYEIEVDPAGLETGGHALVASPSRLIVPAHGQQATRLLYHGDRSVERYYRVRFVPVLPKSADEFALTAAEADDYARHLRAGINVLTGYGVFVIVHPDPAQYDVRTETHADRTVLHNAGNTTAILDDVRECGRGTAARTCSPERTVHLLPGRRETFPHSSASTYRFHVVEGEVRRTVLLDP
jgi:Mat/Ecp fimbriae periplasmic chaperone